MAREVRRECSWQGRCAELLTPVHGDEVARSREQGAGSRAQGAGLTPVQ